MALFNRKKKESVLPEIDKYYDGERRDRAGLAWVLALVSVIAVTILVIGLFLAGRWAYQALTDDNEDVAVVENTDEENNPNFDGAIPPSEDSENNADEQAPGDTEVEAPEPEAAPESADEDADEQGTVEAPARTDTPSTPATGDDPLPNTGPASVVSIFAGVSTLAGGAHYIVSRKRK